MADRKLYGVAIVGLTSLGAALVGCDSAPKPCEKNNIQYYIPGTRQEIDGLEEDFADRAVRKYDLTTVRNISGFWEELSNIGTDPALYRTGTAALIDNTLDPFSDEVASLVLLTDQDYQGTDNERRYRGFLIWKPASERDSWEIRIDKITTARGSKRISGLDNETGQKEVVSLDFRTANLPYSIEELGRGSFELVLESVDCSSSEVDSDSRQSIRVSASN